MKTYRDRAVVEKQTAKIICDCCKKEYEINRKNVDDTLEVQEFHYVNFVGGYNSVFGDGNLVECDLCQHCLDKLLGKYIRIKKDDMHLREL